MRASPFQIRIPAADLADLHDRLRRARWADDFGNQTWRYGVERNWLAGMLTYWRDAFDWRVQEALINTYPQFKVEIDGIPIHFVHVRGRGPRPKPLVISHGWPWTFWDLCPLIGPLTDPAAYGGSADDAFDVVIPSLPGYGFSTPLRTTGVDIPCIAALWVKLMREVLGYGPFCAAGGDWRAALTMQLGHAHAHDVRGVLGTMAVWPGFDFSTRFQYAEDEQWMRARTRESAALTRSHMVVHSHDPQTLAYALVDSPLGTAAWLWERRRAWSDCDGDVLNAFSRDQLCTLASIYWLTGTIGTSLRLYYEHFKNGMAVPASRQGSLAVEVPTGFLVFPKDIAFTPRSTAATSASPNGQPSRSRRSGNSSALCEWRPGHTPSQVWKPMSKRIDKTWLVFISIENAEHDRCVDLFERPDQSCGFEEFRRDVEDCGAWTPVSFFSGHGFPTRRAALEAAVASVPWLYGVVENHSGARQLLTSVSAHGPGK